MFVFLGVLLVVLVICYEIIFLSYVVDDLFKLDWIFNVINDVWFGISIGFE